MKRICMAAVCALAILAPTSSAQAATPLIEQWLVAHSLTSPDPLQHLSQRWPSVADWMVRLRLVEPGAVERWRAAPRWVMPERREWTIIHDVPVVGTERLDAMWHEVTDRDSLRSIRFDYDLSLSDFAALNPDIDLQNLDPGEEVLVWERADGAVPKGIGSPNRGRLRHGEPLPPAEKYVIQYPHRSFGTYYAVSEIKRVFDGFAQSYPNAIPVMVGDLSFRRGRRIRPHRSHQSGRDVVITYPRTTPPRDYKRFHYIRRDELDVEQTLWLVHEFVSSGMVEYIFIDRWIQRKLYREAKRQGAPESWLTAVFEYPGWGGDAIVRRARGHDDHMHIRFWCQKTDLWCR